MSELEQLRAQVAAVEALADECNNLARRLLADDEPSGAAYAVAETLEATAAKVRAALAVGDGTPADDSTTYCGAEMGEAREGECECPRCAPPSTGAADEIHEACSDPFCGPEPHEHYGDSVRVTR